MIDPVTSELRVIRSLDREALRENMVSGSPGNITGHIDVLVMCSLTSGGAVASIAKQRLPVSLLDVNDNPPEFQNSSKQAHTVEVDLETSDDDEVRTGVMFIYSSAIAGRSRTL